MERFRVHRHVLQIYSREVAELKDLKRQVQRWTARAEQEEIKLQTAQVTRTRHGPRRLSCHVYNSEGICPCQGKDSGASVTNTAKLAAKC